MIDRREGGTKRVRGYTLQQIRKRWFEKHPLCVKCTEEGRIRTATQLDHITPLFCGGADDDSNRQSLCKPCHDKKTEQDLGHKPKVKIGPDGFPVE